MERKRTQSGVIYDDDEEEEGKDWKISARERKKARYTENPEKEEESKEEEEEEEEEEKENRDRRISPRKMRRPIYVDFDDFDEDDEDDEDDDEEEEGKQEEDRDNNKNGDKEEEDNEQPGPSTKTTHNQGTCEHSILTVTCGAKTGILDVKKLERGEKCIESGGRWFNPSAFEYFAGKGAAKKWKTSIFHEDKPLQFLFEQGALTTSGYKKRRHKTTKQLKLPSPNHASSESSSEESVIQCAEETEEDDVEDEDWLPGSEELLLETEKVKGGVENGDDIVDSGDDKSEEEMDEMEKGEVEDEDVAAVADDNDNSGFEEREPKLISSISEKSALLKKVEVVIRRLPKMEYPSIIKGAEEENEKEFTQSNEIQDDGQREITTETGDTPTPLHPPATSPQDIKPKTEEIGSTSNQAANLSPSCVRFSAIDVKAAEDCGEKDKDRKRREMGPDVRWTEGSDENSNNELVSMSRSEASDHPLATGDIGATSPIERCVKEEGGDPPTESRNVLFECKYENTDATTFNNDAAQLQVELDTRVLQTTQTSDITQTFIMVQVPSSQPSTSCDLDTMDLDQLRREKIKMQIKVLRLQEQYYTHKINELKN